MAEIREAHDDDAESRQQDVSESETQEPARDMQEQNSAELSSDEVDEPEEEASAEGDELREANDAPLNETENSGEAERDAAEAQRAEENVKKSDAADRVPDGGEGGDSSSSDENLDEQRSKPLEDGKFSEKSTEREDKVTDSPENGRREVSSDEGDDVDSKENEETENTDKNLDSGDGADGGDDTEDIQSLKQRPLEEPDEDSDDFGEQAEKSDMDEPGTDENSEREGDVTRDDTKDNAEDPEQEETDDRTPEKEERSIEDPAKGESGEKSEDEAIDEQKETSEGDNDEKNRRAAGGDASPDEGEIPDASQLGFGDEPIPQDDPDASDLDRAKADLKYAEDQKKAYEDAVEKGEIKLDKATEQQIDDAIEEAKRHIDEIEKGGKYSYDKPSEYFDTPEGRKAVGSVMGKTMEMLSNDISKAAGYGSLPSDVKDSIRQFGSYVGENFAYKPVGKMADGVEKLSEGMYDTYKTPADEFRQKHFVRDENGRPLTAAEAREWAFSEADAKDTGDDGTLISKNSAPLGDE